MSEEEREELLERFYRLLVQRQNLYVAHDKARLKIVGYRRTLVANDVAWVDTDFDPRLEALKLAALRCQEELARFIKNTANELSELRTALFASLLYGEHGRITGVWFPSRPPKRDDGTIVKIEKIYEIVDQYEANKTLTKALEDNKDNEA